MSETPRLSTRQTLVLLQRALRYLSPFRARAAVKLGLGALSLLPLLLLPWPVKILVDQVIEGIPFGEALTPLPFFLKPFVDLLGDAPPFEILLGAVALQALLLLLVGAIGTSSREIDRTDAYLSSGHDTGTRTENEANAGFSLAGGLLGYLDFRWTIRLTQDLNHHYRSRLFESIQSLPMSAFDDARVGDAVYRMMYDTPSITNSCYRILLTPLLATLMIGLSTAMLGLVFGAHPRIVFSGLALLPIALLGTLPFAAALRRRGEDSRVAGATSASSVEEGITNILAMQSLGGEGRERERFDRDSWDTFSSYRSVLRTVLLAVLVLSVPVILIVAQVFLYAIDLVIEGTISRGDFILFLTYFSIIANSAFDIGALWFRVQTSAAGLHRVFFLMDLPSERDAPGARELEDIREGIAFEGVGFRFPDGTPAVRDASFEARRGQVTALVGPAGAGKTTLAQLACGFLEPEQGTIRIDGRPLEDFRRASLRAHTAFVFQETVLFDDSVAENLRLGKADASETELRRAARLAGAEDFIQALPQGYATRLGRGGGKLSVGQKQRLAIARALVRDAPLLVLDEPTSALDPETEARLVEALREASRDRLVLVIAHRLSTVRAADQILFVEQGRIVEGGSHEELMRRPGGAYRRFVELQSHRAA